MRKNPGNAVKPMNTKSVRVKIWRGDTKKYFPKDTKMYDRVCKNPECKLEFCTNRIDQVVCSKQCQGKVAAARTKNNGNILPLPSKPVERNSKDLEHALKSTGRLPKEARVF